MKNDISFEDMISLTIDSIERIIGNDRQMRKLGEEAVSVVLDFGDTQDFDALLDECMDSLRIAICRESVDRARFRMTFDEREELLAVAEMHCRRNEVGEFFREDMEEILCEGMKAREVVPEEC